MEASCDGCGACWSRDEWTEGCSVCGGGALERACVQCGGACGALARRAVLDSNDLRVAHWVGACALPLEERGALVAALVRGYAVLQREHEGRALAEAARASLEPAGPVRRRGLAEVRALTPEARRFAEWLRGRGVEPLPEAWLEQLWSASRGRAP